ncbi:MAG: hypothetical protein EG826_17070 [Deltaproteobacteria bacterium]|nr:hypothetical protein [Deltaproteobacteria bacterium]
MIRRLWLIGMMLWTAALAAPSAAAGDIQPVRETLGRYRIEIRESSASGLSAGGFFANQFFVAYSGIMSGVGVFAGGPYGCARGELAKALSDCMARPDLLTEEVMAELKEQALTHAENRRIDPVENLKTRKVFLFGGTRDRTVHPAVVDRVYDWYRNMGVEAGRIHYKKDMAAGHALPTIGYGNECGAISAPPWIAACHYDGAGEALRHIYGALNPPASAALGGKLIEFAQKDFVDPPAANPEDLAREASLNEFGYAYVPKSCQMGETCRIHVVFHGCRQLYNRDPGGRDPAGGGQVFGLQMVLHAGYNEWADTNRLIVLYPQAQKSKPNPYGCFDWWGYLDTAKGAYLTKDAPQMKAVRAMMKALGGK